MKPFLCIDITQNRKNRNNNEAFVCQNISQVTENNLLKVSLEMTNVFKKIRLPLPIKILQMIDGVVMVVLLRAGLGVVMKDDRLLSELIGKTSWFPFAFIGSIVIFVFLFLMERNQQIKLSKSEEFHTANNRAETMEKNIKAELGVPENAKEIDILTFTYLVKKKSSQKEIKPIKVENYEYYIFVENENLYLSSLDTKYCVPLSCIDSITTINSRIDIPFWNKETQYNKGEYKQYKISKNDPFFKMKKYYVLNVKYQNELWGIYFPCYELPVFEELTGLEAR